MELTSPQESEIARENTSGVREKRVYKEKTIRYTFFSDFRFLADMIKTCA